MVAEERLNRAHKSFIPEPTDGSKVFLFFSNISRICKNKNIKQMVSYYGGNVINVIQFTMDRTKYNKHGYSVLIRLSFDDKVLKMNQIEDLTFYLKYMKVYLD